MGAERYSLDTDVLVYAVDRLAGAKHEHAAELVDAAVDDDCVLTVQALAEFLAVVTRKGLAPRDEAVAQVRDWQEVFPVVAASSSALAHALEPFRAGRLGLWDAVLLATAREAGCTLVLSEDLADGIDVDGVIVRNPFR